MLDAKKPKAAFGIRHLQAVMMFFAMVIGYAMRVNMSMAIVAMTDDSSENTFDWSMQTQSVVLSSFFWGYVVLQIPGGLLADKIGGSILITISIGCNSIITLILPTAANYGGWQAVCACRVLQGLTQGFLFPCSHNLIGKWVPLEDKARFMAFIYSGSQFGTAAQLMLAGYLAEYWGWPSIFYASGVCGVIWTVVYILIGSASPQSSKMISEEEKMYIQSSLGHVGGHKSYPVPWKSVFTSLPFISLIVVNCCQNWGFWTLMTEIPSYMSQVLGVNIKANGVLSALPYITMYLLSFPFGMASDFILAKGWLSATTTRKLSNSIAYLVPAVTLIGFAYVPAGNVPMAVGLLCVVVGLNAGYYTGFMLAFLDMAPNFAGFMLSITNCAANFISFIAPLVAGVIIHDETDVSQWRMVFYLSSLLYVLGNTFYLVFGTSELQSWNEPHQDKEVESGTCATAERTEKAI
ncbi:putative inorganic phosphate cotransporter [Leguminivora glycinivorella]|uniref:putative inorganic phosphate cotransporter n=1 Tax=Leguminivora glycinivorella TaxID=1035111 RepID=UPI00200BB24F|nr:putative inorganic phosphate cotransporter [Leguminivora glycinivorella]XP_047990437.1 putative inorganic phosphate cotransporter [Leguminivora glycinivorella]